MVRKIKLFFLTFIEEVIPFCDKTVAKVSSEISARQSKLNKKDVQEEPQAIHETLKKNSEINCEN